MGIRLYGCPYHPAAGEEIEVTRHGPPPALVYFSLAQQIFLKQSWSGVYFPFRAVVHSAMTPSRHDRNRAGNHGCGAGPSMVGDRRSSRRYGVKVLGGARWLRRKIFPAQNPLIQRPGPQTRRASGERVTVQDPGPPSTTPEPTACGRWWSPAALQLDLP